MGSTIELVKTSAPLAGTLLAAGLGYLGGLRSSREGRHHARVEQLYLDMLDSLESELTQMLTGEGEAWGSNPHRLDNRVRLFAPKSVRQVWREALARNAAAQEAWMMARHHGEVQDGGPLSHAYDTSLDHLAHAMAADLGVRSKVFRRLHRMRRRIAR